MRMCVKYHQAGAENIKIWKKKIHEKEKKKNQRKLTKIANILPAVLWWASAAVVTVAAHARRNTKVSELSFHNLAAFL